VLDLADETHIHDLPKVLANLVEREFIYKRETTAFEGSVEYIFAGNMLRDAIYNALLRRQITTYNRAAAEWLTNIADRRIAEYAPLIADYYEKAEENTLAAQFLMQAGEKALGISAYKDAQAAFARALSLLPDTAQAERMALQIQIGDSLRKLGDLAGANQRFEGALTIARQLKDTNMQANALFHVSQIATDKGDWEDALQFLGESLPLARAGADRATLARVLYGLADTHFRMGNLTEA